jgi:hypothetical protein
MKKLIFLFCITFGLAQNNGIRSLNGSLNNSQRLTVDTTSSATFRWGLSNGVHTLYLPYRIVNPSSGSFKWNVSGQTAKYDSLRLIAGSNISLTQSGNTVTIASSGGGSVGNADSLGSQPAAYYAVKADSTIVSAGYGMSVSRSLHTTTVSADTTILPAKANTNIWSGTNYFTRYSQFSDSARFSTTIASGNSIANGSNSVAFGSSNYISSGGSSSIAGGLGNTITQLRSFAFGTSNSISGAVSGALGGSNIVTATSSYAIGTSNYISAASSSIIGDYDSINTSEDFNYIMGGNYNTINATGLGVNNSNHNIISGGLRNKITGTNTNFNAIIGGDSNYISQGNNSFISGSNDTAYSTTNTGQNYIFGLNNTIGRASPAYGNYLFGQFLRSENVGLWAFGSDDQFQKKIIPFDGTIAFINEYVKHWGSNTMGANGYMPLSYSIQSPHVKDTLMFAFRYLKSNNASDDTGYASIHYELHRQFARTTTSGEVTKIGSEGSRMKRIYSINQNDDDAWHFNTYNTSGRPFAPVYVDSSHLIVSAGYADADSFRLNGTTFLNSTAMNLGSKTFTTTGAGSFGAGTFSGDVAVNGGDITSTASTLRIAKTNETSNIEISGGLSPTNTGAWLALYGGSHATQAGKMFLNGIAVFRNQLGTKTNLTVDTSGITTTLAGSFGAITSTGLSTFGTNAGSATIGAGDSVQVTVTGLTTATGVATVAYKRTGATSVVVADTIASYNITTADKITLYGKYGWTVSYVIGKK